VSGQAAVTMVPAIAEAICQCRWLAFAADHLADRREARTSRTLIVIKQYSADDHVVSSAMKDFAVLWILATTWLNTFPSAARRSSHVCRCTRKPSRSQSHLLGGRGAHLPGPTVYCDKPSRKLRIARHAHLILVLTNYCRTSSTRAHCMRDVLQLCGTSIHDVGLG
jgi:hypothetical protein